MSVDLKISNSRAVAVSDVPVHGHQEFRLIRSVSSIAWKAFAAFGLLMTGIPKAEACCEGLHKFKMLTVYPTLEWLFPSLKKPISTLDTLQNDLGMICPAPDYCPDLNELEEQAVRVNLALFYCSKGNYFNPISINPIREIEILGIKDPSSIIRIFDTCFKQYIWYLPSILDKIHNCEIQNEDDRIRLAWSGLDRDDGWGDTLWRFKEFCIFKSATEDQSRLIKFLEEAAKKIAHGIAKRFKEFDIIDPAARLRIAKLCAERHGQSTAFHIVNFDISDPWARLEVAVLCFQENYRSLDYVESFNITDLPILEKFIDLCFQSNRQKIDIAYAIALNIHKFHILSQETLIKIAERCIVENCGETAENFENFNIKDESARANLLRLGARKNGYAAAKFFRNFKLSDPQLIEESVKYMAMYSGEGVAEFFPNFGIDNENVKEDIAIDAIQQNAHGASKFFHHFNITSPATRAKLAKFSVLKNAFSTTEFFKNFNVHIKEDRKEIAALAIRSEPYVKRLYEKFGISAEDIP